LTEILLLSSAKKPIGDNFIYGTEYKYENLCAILAQNTKTIYIVFCSTIHPDCISVFVRFSTDETLNPPQYSIKFDPTQAILEQLQEFLHDKTINTKIYTSELIAWGFTLKRLKHHVRATVILSDHIKFVVLLV